MKAFILSIIVICLGQYVLAQNTQGITHQSDTSYTLFTAYASTVKKFPQIRMPDPVPADSIYEEDRVSYCWHEANDLKLDVFGPMQKDKQNHIAIVLFFGGGWRSGDRTQLHALAEYLALRGYTCFTPTYRLSTEALFPAAANDCKASLRWVRANAKKYDIDSTKLAVLGFSAGGELAALMGTTNGNSHFEGTGCNDGFASTVQAVIDMDGTLSFVHPESGEGDDSKKISAASYWLGYAKKDNPSLWEEASPLTYVGRLTPPTLFINSSLDRMHAGRTDYIKILDQYHTYSEIQTFDPSPHAFCLFEPWFTPTVNYIDHFLQKVFRP